MKEIVCPSCHTTFSVDDSTYASILSQVRNNEFKEEIESRIASYHEQQKAKEEAQRLQSEKDFEKRIAQKNEEISELKNETTKLKSEIESFEVKLKAELKALQASKDEEMNTAISVRDLNISELKGQLAEKEQETKLKLLEAKEAGKTELHEKERKILELEATLEANRHAAESKELQLKELHKQQLLDKQDEIDRLKDFKLKLSTKMLGETLEQHCARSFEQARSYGQYPNAMFEKDTIAAEGTKGDFIFRDYIDGEEYVSIMFEMKNESDTTANRHKNKDFFDKLDKDRQKKGCEYAVLVSMLEQGNELYDGGIVDVSYLYPKMLVIRPQFFLPVLRLLTEGSRKGYLQNRDLLAELESVRNESRDFSVFEERLKRFSGELSNRIKGAQAKHIAAIEGIDKIIENLEKQITLLKKVKENFGITGKRLTTAEDYIEENLTVKKLTYGAASVRKLIEESSNQNLLPGGES